MRADRGRDPGGVLVPGGAAGGRGANGPRRWRGAGASRPPGRGRVMAPAASAWPCPVRRRRPRPGPRRAGPGREMDQRGHPDRAGPGRQRPHLGGPAASRCCPGWAPGMSTPERASRPSTCCPWRSSPRSPGGPPTCPARWSTGRSCWPRPRASSTACRSTRWRRRWPSGGSTAGCSALTCPTPRWRPPSGVPARRSSSCGPRFRPPAIRPRCLICRRAGPVRRLILGGPGWDRDRIPARARLVGTLPEAVSEVVAALGY